MIKLKLKLSKSIKKSLITTKNSINETKTLDIIEITIRLKNIFHSKFIAFLITIIETIVLPRLIIKL